MDSVESDTFVDGKSHDSEHCNNLTTFDHALAGSTTPLAGIMMEACFQNAAAIPADLVALLRKAT
jgi:hypothetical protein